MASVAMMAAITLPAIATSQMRDRERSASASAST
jgi:hypothetical protein